MMTTGDDLSLLHRALEKTLKQPVSMFKLPSIPDEMLYVLGKMTDVAVNVVNGSARVVGIVADHPTVTLVLVTGVIVGVIYVTGGTSHLIAANQIVGQYVSAACKYSAAQASQVATAAYQYSATQASQAVAYLYSLIPSSITNFVSANTVSLSTSAQQAVSYAYSLVPAETVNFALGSYTYVINAMVQLYESSGIGAVLRIAETQMRTILMPLLQRTAEHFAKHGAKYALAAEVGGVSYALTPPAAVGMRVAAQGVHNVTDMYRVWRLKVNKRIMQRLSEKVKRKLQAIEKELTEHRIAERAKLQAQLPADLTPYQQECPISHLPLKEPVRALLANGVVRYYEREYLADWINFQIEHEGPLVDPMSLLELPYRSADELVVDQEALKIIEVLQKLEAL